MRPRDSPIEIVAARYNAVETAWKIADTALKVSGGFGMFKKSEMERLFRDARAGRFHPANSSLTHELLGKLTLGINPDDPQRWGIERIGNLGNMGVWNVRRWVVLPRLSADRTEQGRGSTHRARADVERSADIDTGWVLRS